MVKPELYIIAGSTACGKTAVAIELAKRLDGEVISADSMQIYKHMDIGTAKPTPEEMDGIPHHLLDVALPSQHFSVAEYSQLATAAIEDIQFRGRVPILAGGTGFYINAVVYGTQFTELAEGQHEKDNQLREAYMKLAAEKGAEFLHNKLQAIDPESARTIHQNNIKRVARALAFCESTGRLFSVHNAGQKANSAKYDISFNILSMPRETLYYRINARVVAMWEAGLPQEVGRLLSQEFHPGLVAMQGIGYKEMIPFIYGHQTKDETIAEIQQATRNYAKRQETWFRHQAKNARLVDVHNKTPKEIVDEILEF
ncbi:MAG: tRNA (adenosine(37)-N6)-dimethylallyltransferase MiaA [Firmicutes bacterium]|nr:tRNA (adenosine(37)-N6)-dimethylallyltransferase MiaA [Bacillota bacterium]